MSEESTEPIKVEEALSRFFSEERLGGREFVPPARTGPFRPLVAEQGSGRSDVSINHDFYLAEEEEDAGPNRA